MRGHQKLTDTEKNSDTGLTRKKPVRINDGFVKALQKPDKGNRISFDSQLSGFGVRITANGHIAFVQNYMFKGRERRITIGSYPTWSVAAARRRSAEIKYEIARGVDPLEDRSRARHAPTVKEMFDRYERDYMPKLAQRSAQDQRSMFLKSILPRLGSKKSKT